jgi:hypothetical protein
MAARAAACRRRPLRPAKLERVRLRAHPLRFIDPTGTDYVVNVDGGQSFRTSDAEFERRQGSPGAGISLLGGLVLAGGRIVGTYMYYSPVDRVPVDAGRRAEPGVNAALALGVATRRWRGNRSRATAGAA